MFAALGDTTRLGLVRRLSTEGPLSITRLSEGRIGIKAPLTKVYEAVATTEGVAGWWTRDTTGTTKPGGRVNVRFQKDGKEIGAMEFEMTRLEPDREVRWRILAGPPEWVGTEVTFELAQDGEMTILLFGHRGWKEPVEFMAHCSMKWA
ncbi:MAG: SRPBCC domain-containing protein, partial [Burkholderia sp.]|nr:SRPBCC domain-containing protein [Burkholderia sp.]